MTQGLSPDKGDAAPALSGALPPWLVAMVCGPQETRAILPCDSLTRPESCAAVLGSWLDRPPRALRPAHVSWWSQHYMACVILPVIAIGLPGGDLPATAPDRLAVALGPEGLPVALRLAGPALSLGGEAVIETLVEGHLAPVIATLSQVSGLAPRVLWGNAAHYLEWSVGWLEAEGRIPAAVAAAAHRWLEAPRRADGRANPLAGAIHYVAGARLPANRRRRVCCLRDQLGGAPICATACGDLCPRTARASGRPKVAA